MLLNCVLCPIILFYFFLNCEIPGEQVEKIEVPTKKLEIEYGGFDDK